MDVPSLAAPTGAATDDPANLPQGAPSVVGDPTTGADEGGEEGEEERTWSPVDYDGLVSRALSGEDVVLSELRRKAKCADAVRRGGQSMSSDLVFFFFFFFSPSHLLSSHYSRPPSQK